MRPKTEEEIRFPNRHEHEHGYIDVDSAVFGDEDESLGEFAVIDPDETVTDDTDSKSDSTSDE